MIRCNNCGFENMDDCKFCIRCGQRIQGPVQISPSNQGDWQRNPYTSSGSTSAASKGRHKKTILWILVLIVILLAVLTCSISVLSLLPNSNGEQETIGSASGKSATAELIEEEAGTQSFPEEPVPKPIEEELEVVQESTSEDIFGEDAISDELIVWNDENLKEAIYRKTDFDGDMTYADAETVHFLDLSESEIHDITDLQYFTNLRELSLKDNYISDISALSVMTNLSKLNLEMNYVKDLAPLADLYSLHHLDLYNNMIEDISSLSQLTKLDMLDLRANYIEDISALQNMTLMQDLYLSDNKISDISAVRNMYNLTYLSFKNNPVWDLSPIGGKNKLNKLILAGTEIQNVEIVESLPSLRYLDIRNCRITDNTPIEHLEKRGGIKIER